MGWSTGVGWNWTEGACKRRSFPTGVVRAGRSSPFPPTWDEAAILDTAGRLERVSLRRSVRRSWPLERTAGPRANSLFSPSSSMPVAFFFAAPPIFSGDLILLRAKVGKSAKRIVFSPPRFLSPMAKTSLFASVFRRQKTPSFSITSTTIRTLSE